MLVGDIVYNDNFDFNANYAIYEYKASKPWYELEPVFSTMKDGFIKPLDRILDMKVVYVTISGEVLIIEGRCEQ